MGIKSFLMRKMIESKMKDIPKEQQEKIFAMVEKNPELFQKIALEIQEEIKKGKNEIDAAITVMPKYQDELQKLNLN